MNTTDLTVTVPVPVVLEALCANREKHIQHYEKAVEGYRAKALDLLEARLDTFAKPFGKKLPTLFFDMAIPVKYISEYDQAIEMLRLHALTQSTVELSQSDYRKFINDMWDWRGNFVANSSAYLPENSLENSPDE